MEDSFPADGNLHQNQTRFVSADEGQPVFSGKLAVQRTSAGLAQDVWDSPKVPLKLPAEPKLIAQVFLDPKNPPKAIMLQYFKKGWSIVRFGATMKRSSGERRERLNVLIKDRCRARQVGIVASAGREAWLAAGDEIRGFAITQFAGTVTWDNVGVKGTTNPALDPSLSFLAWWRKMSKQNVNELPDTLRKVAKEGPDKLIAAADARYANEQKHRTKLFHQ